MIKTKAQNTSGYPVAPLRFRDLLISYIVITLPILLVTNLVFYLIFVPIYQKDLGKMNDDTVRNIRLTYEQFVQLPLEEQYLDVVLDRYGNELMYPLQQHAYDDMWKVYKAHSYLKGCVTASDGLLDAISIYYTEDQFINGSAGFLYASDKQNLLYPLWLENVAFPAGTYWSHGMEQASYAKTSPSYAAKLYCMKAFPLRASGRKAVIVFSINQNYISSLFHKMLSNEEYTLTLYNEQGVPLFQIGDPRTVSFEQVSKAVQANAEANLASFQQDGNVITAACAQDRSLYYVFSLPRSLYFAKTDTVQTQLVIMLVVAFLLVVIMSVVLSRRIYSPIHIIASAAEQMLSRAGDEVKKSSDDGSNIYGALQTLFGHVQTLEKRVELYSPIILCGFYRDLLFNSIESQQEIDQKAALFSIPVLDRLCVFIIDISGDAAQATEMLTVDLMDFINRYRQENLHTFSFIGNHDQVIGVCTYRDSDAFCQLAQSIHQHLSEDHAPQYSTSYFAVGEPVDELCGVHRSYEDAQKALQYGFLYPNQILSRKLASLHEGSSQSCDFLKNERLSKLVNRLDEALLAQFCSEIKQEFMEQYFDIAQIHTILVQIVMESFTLMQRRGVYLEPGLEKEWMSRCLKARTLHSFLDTYKELMRLMLARLNIKYSNANYDLIIKIQQYVQDHLQEDISLNALADIFYISYSHLSKVFKEVTGVNYTEFVMNCRMEEGARLLLSTDWTVDEIARRVAVSNAGYFIRVFKTRYGQTPKQYRLSKNLPG